MSRRSVPATAARAIAALATAALTTVALAAAAPALAAAPAAGGVRSAYRGRTSQGIGVSLSATRGTERSFRYRARMKCTDGTTWLDDYFTDRVTVRAGRFSSHHSAEHGAIVTKVTGTLRGKHATGTIKITERFSAVLGAGDITPLSGTGTIRCQSPTVRWHAAAG
jgi:hypothetical protein